MLEATKAPIRNKTRVSYSGPELSGFYGPFPDPRLPPCPRTAGAGVRTCGLTGLLWVTPVIIFIHLTIIFGIILIITIVTQSTQESVEECNCVAACIRTYARSCSVPPLGGF